MTTPKAPKTPKPPKTPSAPKRPGKYVIYFSRIDDEGVRNPNVVIWAAEYAAKRFLSMLRNNQPITWIDDETWEVGDLRVSCDLMEELWSYRYANRDEREWEVPEPYYSCALRAIGRAPVVTRREVIEATKAGKKPRKPRGDRKPRASRDGLITVQQIAAELKVTPRECRMVLRALKLPKPEAGWAWTEVEAKKIKPQIEKGLKK